MSCPGNSRTRLGNRQHRQVTSSIHQGRPCHPCILCNQGNLSKYIHPKTWKDESVFEQLKAYEPSIAIMPDSCICRLCRDDVSKIVNKRDGFIPRWRKVSTNVHTYCQIPMCNSAVYKVTKVASTSDILKVFGVSDENTDCNENEGTALCVEHYGGFYKHLNPNKRCVTCGRWLTDTTKIRKCPDPRASQFFYNKMLNLTVKLAMGIMCVTLATENTVL